MKEYVDINIKELPFGHGFSKDYIEWIEESLMRILKDEQFDIIYDASGEWIKIKADTVNALCIILVFIGYAFGQQENGR